MNSRAECAMNSMATADFYTNRWAEVTVKNVAKQDLTPKSLTPKSPKSTMKNQNDVIALNIESPITSCEQDFEKLSKTGGGTDLYEKIVKDAQSGMFNTQAKIDSYLKKNKRKSTCFVAGTLVWTDKGKVPIEQIKVGDLVLSKHESNMGEQSYKPVTRTFMHEDEVISLLHADSETVANTAPGASSGPIADTFKKFGVWEHFICVTPNHPFYVKKNDPYHIETFNVPIEGWTEIKYIGETNAQYLQIVDGSYKHAGLVGDFHKTDEPTIGWAPWERSWSSAGYYFDTSRDCLATLNPPDPRGIPTLYETEYYTPMRATVYNIEVADFHTYYVGDLGFWVHNKACEKHEGQV